MKSSLTQLKKYICVCNFSNERLAFIKSIMKKFKASSPSVFIMGIEQLMQIERDIHDVISFGQYIKARHYPTKKKILSTPKGCAIYDIIYIYGMISYSHDKYLVMFKYNTDKDDLNFKTLKFKEEDIDEDVRDFFTVEKGIIPE